MPKRQEHFSALAFDGRLRQSLQPRQGNPSWLLTGNSAVIRRPNGSARNLR